MTQNGWNNQIFSATVSFSGGGFSAGDDTSTYPIKIGTGNAAKNITIGNTSGASAMTLLAGTGASSFSTTNGQFDLRTGTGTINISADATANSVNIGTGGGVKTVIIGSTNTTSTTRLQAGSSGSVTCYGNGAATGSGSVTCCFAISNSSGDLFVVRNSGAITQPLQPAFLAETSTIQSNVTGDGTTYTIIFASKDFDQSSSFSTTTGIFTAPVNGLYRFTSNVTFYGFSASTTSAQIGINAGSSSFLGALFNPYVCHAATGYCSQTIGGLSYMDASDVASVYLQVSGDTTKTIGINAYGTNTSFSGELVC